MVGDPVYSVFFLSCNSLETFKENKCLEFCSFIKVVHAGDDRKVCNLGQLAFAVISYSMILVSSKLGIRTMYKCSSFESNVYHAIPYSRARMIAGCVSQVVPCQLA